MPIAHQKTICNETEKKNKEGKAGAGCIWVCVCVLHIKPFFYSSTSSTPSVRTGWWWTTPNSNYDAPTTLLILYLFPDTCIFFFLNSCNTSWTTIITCVHVCAEHTDPPAKQATCHIIHVTRFLRQSKRGRKKRNAQLSYFISTIWYESTLIRYVKYTISYDTWYKIMLDFAVPRAPTAPLLLLLYRTSPPLYFYRYWCCLIIGQECLRPSSPSWSILFVPFVVLYQKGGHTYLIPLNKPRWGACDAPKNTLDLHFAPVEHYHHEYYRFYRYCCCCCRWYRPLAPREHLMTYRYFGREQKGRRGYRKAYERFAGRR